MSESLKNKTIKGASWSFIDSFASQGITFLVGLVLARLLTPEDYGLIGIITIFISVFNSIVDSGFSNALIRKNDASEKDYNTVFVTNLGVSIVLCAALFFTAPAIAIFFERPLLNQLLKAMSCIVIINAFAIIQRTILVKKIDFKTQTKISVISSIVSGVIGIVMAVLELGVWSLVGQQISKQLLNTILLWVFAKWYPRFEFYKQNFKELFGFGWKLLVSGLIDTIWKEIYQVVIGKCYSPNTLGQYTKSKELSSIFSQNLTVVIQRVSYPVLSSIQDDKLRLKQGYKRIIRISMLFSFVFTLGMGACAKSLILVLLGEQWLSAVPFLQILCFNMMLFPLHSLNLNMLQIQGRSDLFLRLEIIKKLFGMGPLLLGIFVDIYHMMVGSVVVSCFSYYLNAYYSGPALGYSVKEQIIDILPSFCVALMMFIVVYLLSFLSINPFLLFPIQFIVGAIITIVLCKCFKLSEYYDVKCIMSDFIRKNVFSKAVNSNG